MKLSTVVTLVAAGSSPVLAGAGVDWLGQSDVARVLHGEDLRAVAEDIARREFSPNVSLTVLDVNATNVVYDEFGDALKADPGKEYRHVQLAFENHGRLDVAVHTFHFVAFDETHHKYRAEVGIVTRFESNQVSNGQAVAGTVVFLMPKAATLSSILWQGELANATVNLTQAAGEPDAIHHDPAPGPADAPQDPTPGAAPADDAKPKP